MSTLTMKHAGELTLRRFLAEEPLDAAVVAHVKDCAECTARLSRLKDERQAFEAEVPFERFLAGVEKSARQQRAAPRSRPFLGVLVALAACFVAFFAAQQVLEEGAGRNRIKGGGAVDLVIAGSRGQREAAELEQLASGERIRIGVSGHRYVVAMSIDDAGEVSTIYAQKLEGEAQTWLPESFEFTGQGREHLVVVLSDERIGAEAVAAQLEAHFKASGGDVTKLGALEVGGLQVHRTFVKP